MKILKLSFLLSMLLTMSGLFGQSRKDRTIMRDADKEKKALLKTDPSMQTFFDESAGYVMFPNVGKGGFILGGASGNGVLYVGGKALGMVNLKKVNVGFQIGGQAIVEVVFFETEEALQGFKSDEFTFSGEISAVAIKSGVSANAKYKDGVLVVTMPKGGLMADVSVGGQKFEYTPF